jgi:hypothetical protein
MAQPLSMVDGLYNVSVDARPSNYLVNHISWPEISESINWSKVIVVRNTYGFPVNPNDGETIFTENRDAIVLTVGGITASTGAVASVTLSAYPASTYTVSSTFTNIASSTVNRSTTTTPTSPGSGATFNVSTNGSGVPSVTIALGGSGYKTNDVIRLSGSNFGSRTYRTELGVYNKYHIYDTGTSTATANNGKPTSADSNPGYGVTGSKYANGSTSVNPPNKYYYSVFVNCNTAAISGSYWRKIGEKACNVIIDKGTLNNLLGHIPAFYTKSEDGTYNTDLKQFLSLFAFHLDVYRSYTSSLFNSSDIRRVDETLLDLWFKQLGGDPDAVVGTEQLRKYVENIITSYKTSGSTSGLSNLVNTFTGYDSVVLAPKNILPNYNSSSFLESLDGWYPDYTLSGSYATNGAKISNATLFTDQLRIATGDVSGGKVTAVLTSQADYYTTPAYNEINNPYYDTKVVFTGAAIGSISAATSTTNTITYTVTSPNATQVFVGDTVTIDYCTPAQYNTRGVVTTNTNTTFTIANYVGATLPSFTSGGMYGEAANGITITVADSSQANVGDRIAQIDASGLYFPENCSIVAIPNLTTLKLSRLPIQGDLSGGNQTCVLSTNMPSNVMRIKTDYSASSTSVGYVLGLKRVKTAATVSNTSAFIVTPGDIPKAGEYVIDPINNLIPQGAYVSSVNTSTGNMIIRDKYKNRLSVTLTSGAELWFSKDYSSKEGAITSTIAISPSTPYALSAYFLCDTVKKAASVSIRWYDKNGSFIDTSSAGEILVANQAYLGTWYRANISALSPSNAMYAAPRIDVTGITNTTPVYVSSVQMSPPIKVIARSAVTGGSPKATIYTAEPHNFVVGNSITVKNVGTIAGGSNADFDGTFAITDVSQNSSEEKYSVTYATTVNTPVSYQAVPINSTDPTPVAASTPINFEDARMSRIKVRPNRINLLLNPSFTNTAGSTDSVRWAWSGASASGNTLTASGSALVIVEARYSSTRRIPVIEGISYAWSGEVTASTSNSTISTARASITWLDSNDTEVGSSPGTYTALGLGTAVRLSVIGIAPSGATYCIPSIETNANQTAGKKFDLNKFLFEPANTLGIYFDGSTDTNSNSAYNRDTVWEGDVKKGKSHLYQDWYRRKALLDKAITDGMFYA